MPNNYIINSTSDIMIEKKIDEILNSLNNSYDLIKIDCLEDSIITLLQELKTTPFLTDYRVVELKNPKFLTKEDVDKRLLDEFLNYLKNPLQTTIFIMVISPIEFTKLNKEKVFEHLKKCCDILDLVEDISNIDSIIDDNFKGYSVDSEAKRELMLRTEGDYLRINAEIEKLKIYKYPQTDIKYSDVDILVSRDLEDKVFLLTQAIIKKSKMEALNLYNDFKKSGITEAMILSSIINKFQELYQVKLMMSNKYSKEMIAEEFHVKQGRAYYMMNDAKEVRLDSIKDKYSEALQIDYDIKRGVCDKDNALWFYLLKL